MPESRLRGPATAIRAPLQRYPAHELLCRARSVMAMTDGTVRVLVAEDDEEIRQTLRLIVEDGGYEVLEARDGIAALEVLRASQAPLVVLLDLMMPPLDGTGVLQAIAIHAAMRGRHECLLGTAR